jgi:NCS1 family nucleobase:cation symporter-1
VSAGLYLLLARTIDVEGEQRLAEREAEALEAAAVEHATPAAAT